MLYLEQSTTTIAIASILLAAHDLGLEQLCNALGTEGSDSLLAGNIDFAELHRFLPDLKHIDPDTTALSRCVADLASSCRLSKSTTVAHSCKTERRLPVRAMELPTPTPLCLIPSAELQIHHSPTLSVLSSSDDELNSDAVFAYALSQSGSVDYASSHASSHGDDVLSAQDDDHTLPDDGHTLTDGDHTTLLDAGHTPPPAEAHVSRPPSPAVQSNLRSPREAPNARAWSPPRARSRSRSPRGPRSRASSGSPWFEELID